jgi:hopanoid biosynthesis associated RND transporter like protein HpnN
MLTAFAERIVRASRRTPWLTVALILLIAALAVFGAVRTLSMNTDSEALFDMEAPFRVAEHAFDDQFPGEVDLIVAVINGPTVLAAQQAADRLAATLGPRADLFKSVVNPTGGAFFARNGLLYLSLEEIDALSAQFATAQPFLGAIATDRNARGLFRLLDLAFTAAAEGQSGVEAVAPAALQAADVTTKILDGQQARIDWANLFTGLTPPGQSSRAMVLFQPKLDLSSLEQGGDASAFIRDTARDLGLTPENGYRVRLTGQIPLSDEEFASVAEGTSLSGVLSVVLVGILLFMALGSVRVVAATLIALVVGFFLTIGWAALAVGEINLISVAFAVMFVGIAVDFGIQFCMRYRAERHARANNLEGLDQALDKAGAGMANTLTLAAATTAVGFFSFLPTDYIGVSQLGVIAGGGMVIALVLSFTLLPALLRIFRARGEPSEVGYRWAAPLNRALLKHRKLVLGLAAALALVSLAALPRLVFDFDPLKLKDPGTESMSTALELMDDPLVNPNTLNALAAAPEDAKALAAKLSELPEVDHAITVFDVIPSDQEAKLTALEDLSLILGPVLQPGAALPPPTPEDILAAAASARDKAQAYLSSPNATGPLRDAAAKLVPVLDHLAKEADAAKLDALSMAIIVGFDDAVAPLIAGLSATPVTLENLPAHLRATFIAGDGRYRVQIYPAVTGGGIEDVTRFLTAVRTIAPDAIGAPFVIYESGRVVTGAFTTAATLALVAITVLLLVVLHSPGDVARVMAPLLLAGALTLGTCALMGFALNFANIVALPLLLGIGVTFPIYFVTAWREGESMLLTSPAGRGMLFSALTTGAAFGSLAISTHTGTSSMGILLTMALAYTLLSTLIVLPALLGPAPQRSP